MAKTSDITLRPVKGDLAIGSDPVEIWSASPVVFPANTWVDCLNWTFEPGPIGELLEAYFYLKYRARAPVSVTADVDERIQARCKGHVGGWVDISNTLATANIGIAWLTRLTSGWRGLTRNAWYVAGVLQPQFFAVPFDIRIQMRTNEVNEARLEVSSLSYVRTLFKEW